MVSDYRIPNRGMPISKTPGERGDLVVRTSIQFPKKSKIDMMPEENRQILQSIL